MNSDIASNIDDSRFNGWLESKKIADSLDEVLRGADDGELYLQYSQSEKLHFADGRLRNATFKSGRGFGLRAVRDELVGFAHSNDLSSAALSRAINAVNITKSGGSGNYDVSPERTNSTLYTADNPIDQIPVETKIALLQKVDEYARSKDSRVIQVSATITNSWDVIEIMRSGGAHYRDVRPLINFNVNVMMKAGGRIEVGAKASGGRYAFSRFLDEDVWKGHVDEAVRLAEVGLRSRPAPAGQMTVVLGNGWPGVMIHEAVGHGLEGDAIRNNESVYAGKLGEQVAAKGVTIIDDGSINERRGSLSIDDEGTPTKSNVLIEDGILKGFMHDRLSARLMGVSATGNGRRESYAHETMPRMTNTYMRNGERDPSEILASVSDGIYAANFGGGQVDIANGDFVFSCTEAYRIRNGKIEEPIKGATLIGNGPEAMRQVTMIGNDFALDDGIAMCGKRGQNLPVGVGQPTIRMDNITVGGTG